MNQEFTKTNAPLSEILLKSSFSIKHGAGNCGEQAAVAFMFLSTKSKERPLHFVNLEEKRENHAFVALGDFKGGKPTEMAKWPTDTVICDPWMSQGYIRTAKDPKKVALQHRLGVYLPANYVDVLNENYDGWEVESFYAKT